MNVVAEWSGAIAFAADSTGGPSLETVAEHIRSAVIEAGFVGRGRITSGLKEAYRPLGLEEAKIREAIESALNLLLLSGDLEEYSTNAGRGYSAPPPKLIHWGGDHLSLLGSSVHGAGIVRQFSIHQKPDDVVSVRLLDEIGRPEWRNALVELGAADAPNDDPRALFAFCQALAASGERYSLDDPNAVAVLSGRADFFGRTDPALSGRWRRADAPGIFPAAIRTGYTTKHVMLNVAGKGTTLWQPPSRDVWRWIVVGQTLDLGDPIMRYDPETGTLDFLTPPPRQAERVALITGVQRAPWSWTLDQRAYSIIAALMGSTL